MRGSEALHVAFAVRAASDGQAWDADLHAAETLGRWLFLRLKAVADNDGTASAALAAA